MSVLAKTRQKGIFLWQSAWPRRILIGISAVIGVTSLGQSINIQRPLLQPAVKTLEPTELIFQPDSDLFGSPLATLNVQRHELTRENSNPQLGKNADIWFCEVEGIQQEAQFVVSQPYGGWHELCICYEIDDWLLLNRVVVPANDTAMSEGSDEESSGAFALAKFKKGENQFAYLVYSAITADGRVVNPPTRPGRLAGRFSDLLYGDSDKASNLMMVQLFVVVNEKLEPKLVRALSADFAAMRDLVQTAVQNSAGASETLSTATGIQE